MCLPKGKLCKNSGLILKPRHSFGREVLEERSEQTSNFLTKLLFVLQLSHIDATKGEWPQAEGELRF